MERGRVPRPVQRLPGPGAASDLCSGARDRDRPRERLREPCAEAHRALSARLDTRVEDLRPSQLRRVSGDLVQARVERPSGTLREPGVSMAGHRAQEHRHVRRPALAAAGDDVLHAQWVDVRDVESPRDERGQCALRRLGRGVAAVGPEQRDAGRAGVEAARMRSDDGLVDPPVPAFVDRAEPVDEVVVTDVVPAVAPDVVELDPLHDCRCLRLRICVAAGRVVNAREADPGSVGRLRAPDALVRAPRRTRDNRGLRGGGRPPQRHLRRGAPHEVGANTADSPDSPHLDAIGGADPPGIAEMPAGTTACLGRAGAGRILVLRSRRTPGGPCARERAGAEEHMAGAPPVHAYEREPRSLAGRRDAPTRPAS